jgi:hypothetical protein
MNLNDGNKVTAVKAVTVNLVIRDSEHVQSVTSVSKFV